ncbi:PTS system mannose/fructose/N-acetylgalactosamine-transporter subunit IIB [Lacticaseibacillus camelliae]|uniref:PTS EIIB type-4 domain-containing protein n=1 Tax=Lacticaseibacillus camelliae DSM 22697 = JCM 13995 TaxID=1423730 RepID=A0A0R2EYB9_9LACO|nr:PTS sugar transporter subunit IIB [Lacticaseibacillus camelliae]KRN21337.1 hypothetical protein FC75_GL002350 [Lacticaseibacillus camelliae DSM 22697 = JCM 13995]
MAIKFARVDERLVHGQIMTSWIKQYPVSHILIIDDALAADEFTSSVLAMSAPADITIDIQPVAKAAEMLQDDSQPDFFVLFKTPVAAAALVKAGAALPSLNIGNMGSAPDRTPLTRRVFANQTERAAMHELQQLGTDVYLQMLPSDRRVAYQQEVRA